MQTVSQAIEIVSYVTGTSRGRANQFARALLDAGILPKSTGRDIKKIDASQLLPLLAAVAMADKTANAVEVARAFVDLPLQVEGHGQANERLPHFFARAMDPAGGWKSTKIEFSRTHAGFTATLTAKIANDAVEASLELPFWHTPLWGHFCKTSFTISAEGVLVMRNLFARDDLEDTSFSLSTGVDAE